MPGRREIGRRNTPKVEASFRDELARTLQGGFTAAEVAPVKEAYHDPQAVARSQEQALLRLVATREQLGRIMKWDQLLEAKIQALTPDEINAALRRQVSPSALSIVKAGDFRKTGVYQEQSGAGTRACRLDSGVETPT